MTALIVSDCDNTLWCGCIHRYDHGHEVNTRLLEFLKGAQDAGAEVVLWSGGGSRHAANVAVAVGLRNVRAIAKPHGTLTPEKVIAALGRLPTLTIDDDPSEEIDGVDFRLVDDFNVHGWDLRRVPEAEYDPDQDVRRQR